ncbi:MAG: hypothetical protein JWO37_3028 [Acidimicrobiales bacterium]|jgi:Tfp pilus assembly protein FimV|nr:hypothetical protein [Acidimicrobiales bacterium]
MRSAGKVVVAAVSATAMFSFATPADAALVPIPPLSHPCASNAPSSPTIAYCHTVVRGEWLWKIARRDIQDRGLPASPILVKARADYLYGLNRAAIGSNPNRLRVGMELVVATVAKCPPPTPPDLPPGTPLVCTT